LPLQSPRDSVLSQLGQCHPRVTLTAGNGVPPLTPDGTAAPSPGKGLRPFPDPTPARAGTRP
jgi:hypothetical protein